MLNERRQNAQIGLWDEEEPTDVKEGIGIIENSSNKIPILFRHTIPEIPSTTYGTFAIYKYPAKFIPQVIAYRKFGSITV
jgi:hypothetical protein